MKPSQLPIWATDTNYFAGPEPWAGTPTKVAPVLGKLQLGYEPEEQPPAQSDNWWRNVVYQWIAWLDAGDLGDLTVEDLHVTGNATIDGTLAVTSDVGFLGNVGVLGGLNVGGGIDYADGRLMHNSHTLRFALAAEDVLDSTGGTVSSTAGIGGIVISGDEQVVHFRLPPLNTFERLRSLTFYGFDADGASATQFSLKKYTASSPAHANVTLTGSTVLVGGSVTLTPATTLPDTDDTVYVLQLVLGTHGCTLRSAGLAYDVVAP